MIDNDVHVIARAWRQATVSCPECKTPFTVHLDGARYGTKCPHCKEARVIYLPGSGTARRVGGHWHDVKDAYFLPDGERIVTASDRQVADGLLRLISEADGKYYWGTQGPFSSRKKAEEVARAAYASGYKPARRKAAKKRKPS